MLVSPLVNDIIDKVKVPTKATTSLALHKDGDHALRMTSQTLVVAP